MRKSPRNIRRGEFQGPPPHIQRKRQGRSRHRSAEGEHQESTQVRRNRRRNRNDRQGNRENHFPRSVRAQFLHRGSQRRGDRFRPVAGFTGYDDRFEIEVELPGVKEDDISVSVAGNILIVKGKKHRKRSEEKHNFRRSGLKYGKFHRAFPLLPMANSNDIKATFKDGILTIVIPKKEEARPKEIPVNSDN